MSDKVTVNVSFKCEVEYSKFVEMTREEYDAFNARIDAAEAEGRGAVRSIHEDLFDELKFDLNDPSSYDDPELDDFNEMEP